MKTAKPYISKLIIVGLSAFMAAGISSSSSASALDGFSFSDYLSGPGLPDYSLTNPLVVGAECESVNFDSSISCSLTPQDLYDETKEGSLVIHKVDENGNPLEGAKFTIDGIKALFMGGRYVYSPVFGDTRELVTDQTGTIVLAYIPYGEYTIHEVSAPEGYKLNSEPIVVSVNAETMAEQSYSRKNYNYDGEDMTNLISRSATGISYVLLGIEESTYNEERGGYDYDGDIIRKKSSDVFTITVGQSEIDIPKVAPGEYEALIKASQLDGSLISEISEDPDNSNILHVGQNDSASSRFTMPDTYIYDEGIGCFAVSPDSREYEKDFESSTICKEGNTYTLYTDEAGTYFMPHEYSAEKGKWVYDPNGFYIRIMEKDENTIYETYAYAITEEPAHDRYSLWYLFQMPLSTEDESVSINAASITITNRAIDAETHDAENIPNPQTSDAAILKAIIIAGIGLAPIFILRKQLSKRVN